MWPAGCSLQLDSLKGLLQGDRQGEGLEQVTQLMCPQRHCSQKDQCGPGESQDSGSPSRVVKVWYECPDGGRLSTVPDKDGNCRDSGEEDCCLTNSLLWEIRSIPTCLSLSGRSQSGTEEM